MLTPEQRDLHIDGDGNVVGNDNTARVTKQAAGDYAVQIGEQHIYTTYQQPSPNPYDTTLSADHQRASVLVTSRRGHWNAALGVHAPRLDVLPREESIALLRKHRPDVADAGASSFLPSPFISHIAAGDEPAPAARRLPTTIILHTNRRQYYRALAQADEGHTTPLLNLVGRAVERSLTLYLGACTPQIVGWYNKLSSASDVLTR
ncbi:MAG: hypothetical protein JXD18_04605 [Anaerolineae bacterium]|nr:hypothetical protein [Anaerolineae bacterium]